MFLTLLALPLLQLDCAALRRGSTFELRPGVSATLRQTGNERFTLSTRSHTVRASGDCNPDFEMDALVADFNFDGWRDVAVPTGTGYGGVNTFYELYFYRPQSRTFQKSQYTDALKSNDTRANLSPDLLTRTVDGSYKSGPVYVAATLCPTPDGLDLYMCRRGELSQNPDLIQAADDYDWTWFGPTGAKQAYRPLRRSGENRSLWTVALARLNLHTEPALDSKSAAYVIRGDLVGVLELRPGWAHVTFTGKGDRILNGWVQRASIR